MPGGKYDRSSNKAFPAAVSAFRLDRFEVTVGRFRRLVEAGQGTQARPPAPGSGANPNTAGAGWDTVWNGKLAADTEALKVALKKYPTFSTWTDLPGGNETRPINSITWFDAFAFCVWDGGRLPTEAEWNYAAAGGAEQREYPWGAGIDTTHASFMCRGDGVPGCAPADLVPVGSMPAGDGKWGHSDLAGNVFEWTFDWYGSYTTPCNDCLNQPDTRVNARVKRGGGIRSMAPNLPTAYRSYLSPTFRGYDTGFRCARGVR